MENKKPTAVETFIKRVQLQPAENGGIYLTAFVTNEFVNEILELEKEQKADSWNQAICAVEKDKWESFEQYYNKVYGNNSNT